MLPGAARCICQVIVATDVSKEVAGIGGCCHLIYSTYNICLPARLCTVGSQEGDERQLPHIQYSKYCPGMYCQVAVSSRSFPGSTGLVATLSKYCPGKYCQVL